MATRPPFGAESIAGSAVFGTLPIGNRPIISHLLDVIERNRLRNVTIVCPEREREFYAETFHVTKPGIRPQIIADDSMDIAGVISNLARSDSAVPITTTLVIPINVVIDLAYDRLVAAHYRKKAFVTLVVGRIDVSEKQRNEAPGPKQEDYSAQRCDVVVVDGADRTRIVAFVGEDGAVPARVLEGRRDFVVERAEFNGISVLSPEAVEALTAGRESLRELVVERVFDTPVCLHRAAIPGFVINDVAGLYTANMEVWNSGCLKPAGTAAGRNFVEGDVEGTLNEAIVGGSFRGAGATVCRSIIGRRCTLAAGASVTRCVLLDGAIVEEGANLKHCLVGTDVVIGAQGVLDHVIVRKNARTEKKAELKKQFLVALATKPPP